MKQESARETQLGKVQISDLPFSEIPHQSRLFLEYQSDPLSLKRFYPNAVSSPSEIRSFVPEVLANYHTDRNALCDALTEINVNAGAGKQALDNIELLRDSKTVAVLTGQQAGFISGPLYTIYKALSAIKMAATLKEQGISAVSVFWAATEDHDFEEVSQAFFIGKTGEIVKTKYKIDEVSAGKPVGDVTIDSSIGRSIDELFEQLSETEFSPYLKALLASTYAVENGFGDAFIKTLAAIFAEFGLIFIDPMHRGIKALSSSIYAEAIEKSDEIVEAILERSRQLEADGYHSQVLVEADYFPLFLINDDGKRTALRKSKDNGYRVKDDRRDISRADLIKIAQNEPQRLSPGVMLRPVVQDYLLPTLCYFGGAAEIAYFAQNSEAYRILNRPVTPTLHRQSFTIIEAKHRKVLEKFDLTLSRLFDGVEIISLQLAENIMPSDTAGLFANVEEIINTEFNRLDQYVSKIDVTVAENLAKRRRKMIYHIAALRKKTLLAQVRKDEITYRQIENLFTSLLPQGGLQERTLNVFTYLNKFGPNFIEWLYQSIDLEDKDHRIVDL